MYGEARRLAAEEARRRAQEYAEALGLAIDRVAWVAEPGLRRGDDGGGYFAAAGMARASAVTAGGDDQIIHVAPDEMTVRAAVEVGFTFTGPSRAT